MLCSRLRLGPGKDEPLVGIAGSLFFGQGRGTKTPDARRAQHAAWLPRAAAAGAHARRATALVRRPPTRVSSRLS